MVAQLGDKAASVKPLKGFGGAGVLEVIENHEGDIEARWRETQRIERELAG